MRFPALALLVLPILFSTGASAQATLNKCTDAEGRITYSNLPCRNAAAVRRIEIDPPPPVPVVVPPPIPAPAPVPAQTAAPSPASMPHPAAVPEAAPAPAPVAAPAPAVPPTPRVPVTPAAAKAPVISIEPASRYIEIKPTPAAKPAARAAASQCNALSEQLGRIFDKMDAARRVGASQEQMRTWNEEIKELERTKQQSGCF